ncbi:cytochrome b5-like heme/steroid binding domain-containing protein [Aspergillus pseudoustus]|uniref:Cytochrome b5-like heme/steroid binding domain-containing protein n=1 Tax=Aspergillus pseudoustus TaxID=1810923 RepID=A0ABR4KMS8_9EURO
MSELRQRSNVPKGASGSTQNKTLAASGHRSPRSGGISFLDVVRVLATLVAVSCGLSYYLTSSESLIWGYQPWLTNWSQVVRYVQGPVLLTPTELALHDGTDPSLPIYVAVNGTIFDVSANPGMYGPGGSYHFFAGRDATRAFVTGCFQEDLTDDLTGVEDMFIPVDDPAELERLSSGERKKRREQDVRLARKRVEKQVNHWVGFFGNHKKYFEVGRVIKDASVKDEQAGKRELCEAAKKQRPKREKSA